MSGALYPVTTLTGDLPAPPGWRWRLLTQVARLESGHTPSRRQPEYWNGGDIPWLSLKDIRHLEGRQVFDTADKPTQEGIDNSSARILPKGTVAFCRTASVGKVAILGRDMATSQDFANWVCGPNLLPEYLFEALRASGGQFDKEKQGTTHKTIYMPVLENFRVLVPPLPEQHRIADMLDKADAIRRKRQAALSLTEDLLRSAFLEMFGDPVTNPKGWKMRKLGEVTELYAGNSLPSGISFSGQVDGVLLLKVGDMNLPGNEFSIVTAREWAADASGGVIAPAGAIVIPKRGGAIATNKKRILSRSAALDPNLMGIAPSGELSLQYLRQWFHLLDLASLSSGSAVPQLNKKDLTPLILPVPPMKVQEPFCAFERKVEHLRERAESGVAMAEALFSALMSRAFHGELTSGKIPQKKQLEMFPNSGAE